MNMHRFATTLTTSLLLLLAYTGLAHATGIDDGFDPNANHPVRTIVQQRNGGLLVGGQFTAIGGLTRNLVARLNADGSADAGFNPDVRGSSSAVFTLHEQPGGKVLIGGRFTEVSGQPRSNIARVTATGAPDATFNPAINGPVLAFASQLSPDGLSGFIYVGGDFFKVNGEVRQGFVRLLANGSVDTSFTPPAFNGEISAIELLANGSVLVAGTFDTIDGNSTDAPIARLNSDGSLDSTFDTELSNGSQISDLAVQPDGSIFIAGKFDSVGGQPRRHIARLHPNGQLDDDFVPPQFNNGISAMVVQADGRIMVAGRFTNAISHHGIARLHADGSYDPTFSSAVSGGVYTVVRQADGKYVIGGDISDVSIFVRNHIARLDDNGFADADFIADMDSGPNVFGTAVAVQADGKVLVGGKAATTANSGLTRLYGNGLHDIDFLPFINDIVHVIIAQPNEKIVIAGQFDNVGDRIARLNKDGSFDNTFYANANDNVYAGALQRNGRIVVGGAFTNISGFGRSRLARLQLNGTPEQTFNPNVNGNVSAVFIQPDGKILIGGEFTEINNLSRAHIARLNANGSVDVGFEAVVDETVRSIAVDADGRILIGGDFNTVGGTSRVAIARLLPNGSVDTTFATSGYPIGTMVRSLALMSNGRIIIGGDYSIGTQHDGFVRRLSRNGALDLTFDPGFERPSVIESIVVQPDGKLLFAGAFGRVGGEPRSVVARYAQTGPTKESLELINGSDLVWVREGSGPELSAAPVVLWSTSCCNREDFVPLPNGIMQREPHAWVLEDIPTTGEGTIWLRAVSIAGDGGQTVGPIESPIIALELDGSPEPSDRIFADGFEVVTSN